MSDPLNPPKDLTDPQALISECEACISGLDLEIQAKNGHSAMGGVPDPLFFFVRTRDLVRAMKVRLEAETKPKAEPEVRKVKPPKEQS